ncbi:hypothetical protein QYF61_027717 [Mycteria americana]|uniref:Uncharacterized protein n=1 Tax=Mycteria americana TaxID=33587 RepID=A0AAN7NWD9_MYCAM|nr:hypothetical protein QYF61_027717 [Mycteria americana]
MEVRWFAEDMIIMKLASVGASWLGVHKELGGDTARTVDPNRPKTYSMPYNFMLSDKNGGEPQPETKHYTAARSPSPPQWDGGEKQKSKTQIHLSNFNLSSLIHLLVVLMFLSGPTLGYLEYSGPWILCIPDSKTLGVDLECPLELSARGSRAALAHIIPQPIWKPRIALTQVSDPALGLVEPHDVHTGPLLQLVQVPLDDNPPFWHVNCASQLGAICKLAEGALDLAVNVIDENIEQHWSQYEPLRDTACQEGWRLNHFPGKPVPMLDNPLGEIKFPNIQSKPPLAQLEAISSCPITCYLGEETDPHLSTTSFQGVVESDKVSPEPPFLQAKQPQLPQPLLIRLVLQTLHQLRCPSLDTFQHLNVPLVVTGPKLNTVFEDAIGFLGRLGTLLAHIQAAVNQHSQVLLCQAAFQPLFPKPVALHGVAVAQVQDLALGLVKPHTIDLGPSIQPVRVPLQSLPTLKQINAPTQLGVICKLAESALDPFVQIIDKDVKQNWPQHKALGNTACDRPPTPFTTTLWARPSSQFFTQRRVGAAGVMSWFTQSSTGKPWLPVADF